MVDITSTQFRKVTGVTPDRPADISGVVANITGKALQAQEESKILNGMSKARLKINDITNQYRIDNQANPMGNIKQYERDIDKVFKENGSEVGGLYQNEWNNQTRKFKTGNFEAMQKWSFGQNVSNAKSNLETSMMGDYQLANIDGKKFGLGEVDGSSLTNFIQSGESLAETSGKYLGETDVNTLMEDYKKDYIKSFVTGAVESNPDKGMELLDNENVKGVLTESDIKDLKEISQKITAENVLKNMKVEDMTAGEMVDLVNDDNVSDFEKQVTFDKQELSGNLNSKTSSLLKKLSKSRASVDAIDDTISMGEVILQVGELKGIESGKKYLEKMGNIRNKIIELQNAGKLSKKGAKSLNTKLRNDSIAKSEAESLSEISTGIKALSPFSYGYNNALKYFKGSVGEENSTVALRDYFYATQDKDYSDDEKEYIAMQIAKRQKQSTISNTYNSVEEANRANLPKGTEIIINGVRYRN